MLFHHFTIQRAALFAVIGGCVASVACADGVDNQKYLIWGAQTAQRIEATLRIPQSGLYAEIAYQGGGQWGIGGTAFAWPWSTQFRVLNSLARINPTNFTPRLLQFSDQLHAAYWSPQGGYYCCNGGGDRFYDDNAHIAVALAEAYEITGNPVYLERAEATYDFLLAGEAPGHPGGSYWSVQDHSFLDTASSLQGAKAAVMLYKATGEEAYLTDAVNRYNWARDNTQVADGTFLEKVFLTGPQAGTAGNYALVNFAGFGISANLQLYDVTADDAYLFEAQRIATTSLIRYFDGPTGRVNDEGYWAFELTDALVDLYERDQNPKWINAVARGLDWLHANKKDPAGHYGLFWGRGGAQVGALTEWHLNDMASVARAYLHLGLSSEPAPETVVGDYNGDGVVDAADYTVWRDQFGSPVALPNDAGLGTPVRQAHYQRWRVNYGAGVGASSSSGSSVPEGGSFSLACLAATAAAARRRPPSTASGGVLPLQPRKLWPL